MNGFIVIPLMVNLFGTVDTLFVGAAGSEEDPESAESGVKKVTGNVLGGRQASSESAVHAGTVLVARQELPECWSLRNSVLEIIFDVGWL